MAYGIFLALDQDRWFRGDFSSDNALTGTIFTDVNNQNAKNLTGFTITIRMHRPIHFGDFFNKEADIVIAANGTFKFNMTEGDTPPRGIYYVKVEIKKAGVVESTLNREELHILGGPNA